MTPEDAVAQIRRTAFKPGWTFQAYRYDADQVFITLTIDTVDTSYPSPDGQCRRPLLTGSDKLLDVSRLDEAGLCWELLKMAAEVDEHENREFLKIRRPDGTWESPLHPHTTEGELSWLSRQLMEAFR